MSDPYSPDDLRDALDHIMRVAKASRTASKRDNWIVYRAHCALTGSDDWNRDSIPKMGLLNHVVKLQDALKLAVEALEFAHGGEPVPSMEIEAITRGKAVLAKLESGGVNDD